MIHHLQTQRKNNINFTVPYVRVLGINSASWVSTKMMRHIKSSDEYLKQESISFPKEKLDT